MPRIKIDFPSPASFNTIIPVRITDINYGGHVGNDTILSLLHEARMQFLESLGYTELNMEGLGLIMSDVAIEFKKELFYGDTVKVSISSGEFTKASFDLYYLMEMTSGEKLTTIAIAKTGMVCFNYGTKKVSALPAIVISRLQDAVK